MKRIPFIAILFVFGVGSCIASNPVHYWSEKDTQPAGSKLQGVGWENGVLSFDGEKSYLELPNSEWKISTGNGFTVSGWIRLRQLGQGNRNPIAGKQGEGKRGFLFLVEENDHLAAELWKDGKVSTKLQAPAKLSAGRWYHVALRYSTGVQTAGVALFIDGVSVAESKQAVISIAENECGFQLGRYRWSASYQRFFKGWMDDVLVFNSPLTDAQLKDVAKPRDDLFSPKVSSPSSDAGRVARRPDGGKAIPGREVDFAFFERSIRPVLVENCYECHSSESGKRKGGLLLDSRDGLLAGGDSGPAVVPGSVNESLLLTALRHDDDLEMPPREKLSSQILADFEDWILDGAPDPRSSSGSTKTDYRFSTVDYEKGRDHWAFQPVRKVSIPQVRSGSWVLNPIDAFILRKLEEKKMKPAPSADPAVLLRRLHFSLTGLPPATESILRFLEDPTDEAYRLEMERLLDSPHYGERWGRHWLDVVRYADTNGGDRENNYPTAWRFRDYVIDSFRVNKPYDLFVREQLAGDLMRDSVTIEERRQRITATGMLALGPKQLNEQDKRKMLLDIADEQVDVVSKSFLGLTVSCARCHDHKFDPVSTRDYYAMAGIFMSTKTMAHLGNVSYPYEEVLPRRANEKGLAAFERQMDQLKSEIEALRKKENPNADERDRLKLYQRDLKRMENDGADVDRAFAVREGDIEDLPVHIRGSHLRLENDKVSRGVPAVFDPYIVRREIPSSGSGRLELAEWITDPAHPLTARVMVNRVWNWHFGQGLVESVSNWGLTGSKPSHPELLDWLAGEFVESGWSMHHLHRLILTSRTWRMAASNPNDYLHIDPDNRFYSRQNRRRLEAEAIRDALLFAGGNLSLEVGGQIEVKDLYEGRDKYQVKNPELWDTPRRAVYLPRIRNDNYSMFALFDHSELQAHVGARPETTVPAQALFFLNNPLVVGQARSVAESIQGRSDLVQSAYLRILGRLPTDSEKRMARSYLRSNESDALATFCQILFASNEFSFLR